MSRVRWFSLTVIAVTSVAGCVGTGDIEEFCPLGLPHHGLQIQIEDAAEPPFRAGNYRFDVTADDEFDSAVFAMPVTPETASQPLELGTSWSVATITEGPSGVVLLTRQEADLYTGPDQAQVAVFLDDELVGEASFSPVYAPSEEQGEGCGQYALVTDAMAIDTGP